MIAILGCQSRGTELTIENKGHIPLDSVTVHVTGNEYFLGHIPAGDTRTEKVYVKDESHIELSDSRNRRLVLDVYLEPGYSGTVCAKITSDSVLSVVQNARLDP